MNYTEKAFDHLLVIAKRLLDEDPATFNTASSKLLLDMYNSGIISSLDAHAVKHEVTEKAEAADKADEVKEEKPKKRGRKPKAELVKEETESEPVATEAKEPEVVVEEPALAEKVEETSTEEILDSEEVPVTDFDGNPIEDKSPMELLGSEDVNYEADNGFKSFAEETAELEEKGEADPEDVEALKFDERQLDCYVSKYKREDEMTEMIAKEMAAKIVKIRTFVKEDAGNQKVLQGYLDEILEDEDKNQVSLSNITPYYLDYLAHYLDLREEINRYSDEQIVEAMEALSGGVLNDVKQLNRYNIEAILSVLKA
jgi:hypothetical protein|nr:MAG TPA: hypothetical protein [Caudoviricetes sp.]